MSIADLKSLIGQTFPGKPKYTEDNVPDLTGKVCIVTGANTGVGKETAQILYSKNARVYIAARSEDKSTAAIKSIKQALPESKGELAFIRLDLADLATIRSSVDEFLAKENRLDVLFNNAGVGFPEGGSKTKQGYELQIGVNCIGHFMFTKLLTPKLIETARSSPPNSVRVIWVSSSAAEGANTKKFFEGLKNPDSESVSSMYFFSKLGNYFQATEFANRHRADGITSVSLNPGNLDSELWRTQGAFFHWLLRLTLLHPSVNGAYTSLFAAFSPQVPSMRPGGFVAPWGRIWTATKAMSNGATSEAEGGTGMAAKFWEWNEAQVERYL